MRAKALHRNVHVACAGLSYRKWVSCWVCLRLYEIVLRAPGKHASISRLTFGEILWGDSEFESTKRVTSMISLILVMTRWMLTHTSVSCSYF